MFQMDTQKSLTQKSPDGKCMWSARWAQRTRTVGAARDSSKSWLHSGCHFLGRSLMKDCSLIFPGWACWCNGVLCYPVLHTPLMGLKIVISRLFKRLLMKWQEKSRKAAPVTRAKASEGGSTCWKWSSDPVFLLIERPRFGVVAGAALLICPHAGNLDNAVEHEPWAWRGAGLHLLGTACGCWLITPCAQGCSLTQFLPSHVQGCYRPQICAVCLVLLHCGWCSWRSSLSHPWAGGKKYDCLLIVLQLNLSFPWVGGSAKG